MHIETEHERQQPTTWLDYLAKGVETVMVILTALMVILVSYQVFERYVLHYTPPWSEELSVYLMIWFGIIGIAVGVRRNAHMALHFFADLMPSKVQQAIVYVKYFLIIAYAAVLAVEGIRMVELTMTQKSPAIGMPVGYVYLCLPLSMILIIVFTLEAVYKDLSSKRRG